MGNQLSFPFEPPTLNPSFGWHCGRYKRLTDIGAPQMQSGGDVLGNGRHHILSTNRRGDSSFQESPTKQIAID
jgi:hypothetical protein